MISTFLSFSVEVVILIGVLASCARLFLNWNRARQLPETHYVPDTVDSAASWTWASPPECLKLEIKNTEQESLIQFDVPHRLDEAALALFAAFLAGTGVYLSGVLVTSTLTQQPVDLIGSLIIILGLGLSAWALTRTDTPIVAIARNPQSLRLTLRQAYFFKRSILLQKPVKPGTRFKGKLQNFIEMTVDQLESSPDYYLSLIQPGQLQKRFILRLPPAESSWIVQGLNQWLDLDKVYNQPQ